MSKDTAMEGTQVNAGLEFTPVYFVRPRCPRCKSARLAHNGRHAGVRFLRCRRCGKRFKAGEISQEELQDLLSAGRGAESIGLET